MTTSALSERTVSAFPVSIGTALAFESLLPPRQKAYDPEREIPDRTNLSDYAEFWINIETLYRNILGSVPTEIKHSLQAMDVLEVLLEEIDYIQTLVKEELGGRTKLVFYRNKHVGLSSAHPYAKLRVPTTPTQIVAHVQLEKVCDTVIKKHEDEFPILDHRRLIKPKTKTKALILTHQAYDLHSRQFFDELDLIESHTGVCKKSPQWYTKINGGKEFTTIPFNICMLQVFGDSHVFAPQPIALRKQVIELSQKFKWHSATTRDRITFSFDSMTDVFSARILKSMMYEI